MRINRDRLHELSDEYERRTGKSILLYISRPTPRSTRYVFTDHVSFTYDKAVQYMERKLAELP